MSDEAGLPPRTGGNRPKKKASESGESAKKPGPSAARRIISWVFILLLAAVVVFEWRAKSSYTTSLQALESCNKVQQEKNEELILSDADNLVKGMYTRTESKVRNEQVIEYRWKSLFRKYVIYMVIEKGSNAVMFLQTEPPE